jgi:hypothetical protein
LVGNDIGWYAVQILYLSGKSFREIFTLFILFLEGYEVCHFGKYIDDYPELVTTFAQGEVSNKIHGY